MAEGHCGTKATKQLSRRAFLGRLAAAVASSVVPTAGAAAVQTSRTTVTIIGDSVERGFFIGRADAEPTNMVHTGLARKNGATGTMFAVLAKDLPSEKQGTFKVNADGSVLTVYKLKSGLTWHDGRPLTAKDFILGWKIMNDPKVPWRGSAGSRLASSVTAADELTLVIHWKKLHWSAVGLGMIDLVPLPTHLLEDVYAAGDYDGLIKLPYWNRRFVGAGPYKVVEWGPGDQITLEAFPNYSLGRPKIDRVVYQFIADRNASLANVLADQVDVSLNSALGFDQAVVAQQQWEAKGKGKVFFSPNSWVGVVPNPTHEWFKDIRVRQALLHAIDRRTMVMSLFGGKLDVAHFMMSPKDAAFPDAIKRAVKYDYDPEKSKQLLAQAGWKPGADGVLNNAKGERFSVDGVTEAGNRELEHIQAATIAYWKSIGVEVQIKNLPRRQLGDEKYRANPGTFQWRERNNSDEYFYTQLNSTNIPKAEDRYSGQNTGGWNNSRADEITERLEEILLQPGARALKAELMRLLSHDLPWLPLYYFSEHVTVRSSVKGVQPRQAAGVRNATVWNIHSWMKG